MKDVKSLVAVLLTLLLAAVTGAGAADVPKTLRFGLLPAEDATTMVRDFSGS